MDTYEFSKDCTVYSDCNTSSTVTGNIKAGEVLLVSEVAGAWYHTSFGWIYGFNGTSPIVKKVSTGQSDLTEGSYIVFDQNAVVYDVFGALIPISSTNYTFTVADTNDVNNTVLITDGINNYWVPKDDVKTANNGVIVVPSEIAQLPTSTVSAVDTQINSTTAAATLAAQSNDSRASNFLDSIRIKDMRGVFGMPYQYMTIADPRIDANDPDSFGGTYAEKIVARLPLLVMVPGTPEFLTGYGDKEKKDVLNWAITNLGSGGDSNTDFDSLINNPGKYYGLKVDWTSYFMHVNPMCRAAAKLLGLQDYIYYDSTLGSYSWEKNANEDIKSVLNYRGGVAFYLNSENQVSESFGNSSTQSMIASKINGLSELGKEMNFLLGGAASVTGASLDAFTQDKQIAKNESNQNNLVDSMISGHNLIEGITSGLKTVIAGGKLQFPEIWSDSQFSRDYDVSIKLTTPDCDPYSLYLNIIVPMLHLVGFVAPRSTGVNGYVSPFLVRAFYKGMFNCDMGIITNMSIQKGSEGSWSPYGIPTSIEIHFTIKELYGTMAISSNANIKQGLLRNIMLMDYIGNLCGININEADIKRTLYFYYSQYYRDKFKDKVYLGAVEALDQWATNKLLNWTLGEL